MSKVGFGIQSRKNAKQFDAIGLTDAYTEMVSQFNPDYFCTFTTQHQLTLPSARRAMVNYSFALRRLMAREERLFLFWVAEPFELKEGFHTHGLLSVPSTFKNGEGFQTLRKAWTKASGSKAGGARAQFSPVRSNIEAVRYVTKYTTKTQTDWDIVRANGMLENTLEGVVQLFR